MSTRCIDLGTQPLANKFIPKEDLGKNEYKYHLAYEFNPDTYLLSMVHQPDMSDMFNDSYPYDSSGSATMVTHFKDMTDNINKNFFGNILEIGSNSGPFICNIDKKKNPVAIEPCSNFAKITRDKGIPTYDKFWNSDTAYEVMSNHGFFDVVYSANCMCHIKDVEEAFFAVRNVLSNDGTLIMEDPSLIDMLKLSSYNELYDEHFTMFSVHALQKLLGKVGLYINKVEYLLNIHGGSNRIYASKTMGGDSSLKNALMIEKYLGVDKVDTYHLFNERIQQHRDIFTNILYEYKDLGKKIISYGATSKATTTFNYCGIDSNIIDYITDTTPAKQGLYSPGMHIPVVSPEEGLDDSIDIIHIGAWNYTKYIMDKEVNYQNKTWLTEVPFPRIIKG